MNTKLSEILKSILLIALIIGLILVGYAIYKGVKDVQNGSITDPLVGYYDTLEDGMDFQSHPRAKASKEDDYRWSMEYMRNKGIELTEQEQYIVNGLYSGKLSYILKENIKSVKDAAGIGRTNLYYVYGDGDVYGLAFCGTSVSPKYPELEKLSPNVSPMALIVIQAGIYGNDATRLTQISQAKNSFELLFMAPVDAIALGLFSYL